MTSGTSGTSHKDKSRNQRSTSNSQQTTLQMSHSPTSKSQMYYDNAANGGSNGTATRSNGNATTNMQEYRSNGRSQQRNGNGKSNDNGNNNNSNGHYDRYDRSERNEPQQHHQQQQSSSGYSRNSYADRAYSLPRQQHQQQSNMQPSGYYTQDRRDRSAQRQPANDERRHYRDRSREDPRLVSNGGADTPDFYFMPSQRKYSGEVVRVYVDYNKDPKH